LIVDLNTQRSKEKGKEEEEEEELEIVVEIEIEIEIEIENENENENENGILLIIMRTSVSRRCRKCVFVPKGSMYSTKYPRHACMPATPFRLIQLPYRTLGALINFVPAQRSVSRWA
jgi:hypothetical protein